MAAAKTEQRVMIKFMAKEALCAKEIHDRLVAVHRRGAVSRSTVQRWLLRFQNTEEVKDLPRSGRPSQSAQTIQAVSNFIQQDKRHTLRQTAAAVGISSGLVHKILHKDLQLKKRAATWLTRRNDA